jgi:spermidine synthase
MVSSPPNTPELWFTERDLDQNMGFSLRIRRHIHSEQSPLQRIDIYDTYAHGRMMTLDGLVMVTERDEFIYHEMIAHVPLFSHPDPRQVLIIGGGDGGTLREVLRHPGVECCVMVEIDAAVVEAARRFLPSLASGLDDARAEIRFEDGIAYVQNAADSAFDVILIDCTDPVGPAEGLFQLPFYRQCLRVLGSAGILCQQTESPLYMPHLIRDVHAALRTAGFEITRSNQAHCVSYPSGWWSFTLGSKGLDPACDFRQTDAANRAFETKYYNERLHAGCFMLPTMVSELIASAPSADRENEPPA